MAAALIIPQDINTLSATETFRFYSTKLRWHVHPVYPPAHPRSKHPGKQPAIDDWWNVDPEDINLGEFFGTGAKYSPFNIGVAPRDGNIFVDLDSKHNQGASVRKFVAEQSDKLATVPAHNTTGGVHLVFRCPDLPIWKRNGKLNHDVREAKITDDVKAELYFDDHQNLVLPPSVHPVDLKHYLWTVFGEIPEWSFAELSALFGFEPPVAPKIKSRSRKEPPWFTRFSGDLSSLDLLKALEHLGLQTELEDADECRYRVTCPWRDGHTDKDDDSGTKIGVLPGRWPWFTCHHTSCKTAGRSLQALLEWAESKIPGIVDSHCAQQRLWDPATKEHTNKDGRPRILHAEGRLESEVYTEVGATLAPHHSWFVRADSVNVIREIPSGFLYSSDPASRYKIEATTLGFGELSGLEAKGNLERFIEPGVLRRDDSGALEFVPKSFSTDFCSGMLKSCQLKAPLDHIARILPVRLPFRVDSKLVYPKPGYDPQFATYCLPDAPKLSRMPMEKAWKIIDDMLDGFCFASEQSRTHAIARLLTPFARAILGWTTRVPLWFFAGNRPRCGKDYLSGCSLIIYEGRAFEDFPIGKDQEETAKRIMSAARNGRRFMHFSNCQVFLQDQYLTQALTNPVINGRRLGSNDSTSDLSIPNEMEYSISANIGLQFREDLEPRMRKIELAFYEEDANKRTFPDLFLHRTIRDNRAAYLSAMANIFAHWEHKGFPSGQTPFTTYPEWGAVIGGIMAANGRGDPCLPFVSDYAESGTDRRTLAMGAVFTVCHAEHGETKLKNKQIYATVAKYQNADSEESVVGLSDEQLEALRYYGNLEEGEEVRKNQTRLMQDLRKFKNRELGGIKMLIESNSATSKRDLYRFVRREGPDSSKEAPPNCPPVHLVSTISEPRVARENTHTRGEKRDRHVCTHAIDSDPQKVDTGGQVDTCPGAVDTFSPILALDIETGSDVKLGALDPWNAEIRLVSLADEAGNIQLFDLRDGPLPTVICSALKRLPLIIHGAAFELRFFALKYGMVFDRVFCTLTAARLLTPSKIVKHDLGTLLERYLGIQIPKELGASDWGGMLLTEEQYEYARNDVRYLHALRERLEAELKSANLLHVFELESALLPIITRMEVHGFPIDSGKMQALLEGAEAQVTLLEKALREAFALPTLNVGSPEQLLEAFAADGIKLEDTSEETLCTLTDPRGELVLKWRSQAKLSSSIGSLLSAERDGRIHAQFNPLGAVTGRFSSKKPNLQNVTRGALRSCFIPSAPDRRLIVADYSQIELRVVALVAGETVMIDAFKHHIDLHYKIAAVNLRKSPEAITKEERNTVGKSTNFGFIYGQKPKGFRTYARASYGLELSLAEAESFHTNFFQTYPAIFDWHQKCWEKAHDPSLDWTRTIFGRLLVPQKDRAWGRFNMWTEYVVSGSCADLLKVAMVKIASILPGEVQLLATVHDELVYDAPADLAEQYCGMIRLAMEDAFREMFGSGVPIEVEAKVCSHWGEK